MTVRITTTKGKVILCGDSYKSWNNQIHEYLRSTKTKIRRIETSRSKWIGMGGLKWCEEGAFPDELTAEGKGRSYKEFNFSEASSNQRKKVDSFLS